jgi:uncharacterized delta-60 repeat protein
LDKSAQDHAYAIAKDSDGNVYVAGYGAGMGTGNDYITIKYDSAGNQLWVQRYNGPGNGDDVVYGIAVDSAGNVYVTGSSYGIGTGADLATIKYNGQTGAPMWDLSNQPGTISTQQGTPTSVNGKSIAARYNGPGNLGDGARNIGLDSAGNVYVTGTSQGVLGNLDFATIKYNGQTGAPMWKGNPGIDANGAARYDGPGHGDDTPFCGYGTVFNRGIPVDSYGNVYVTGMSRGIGTNYDYATIKYDVNGAPCWNFGPRPGTGEVEVAARYDGSGGPGDEMPLDIALDSENNVYVTGFSYGSETNNDFATIKYDNNGNQLWVHRYNGLGNGSDIAYGIATDSAGNVYVTGVSLGSGTDYDYATIKYSSSGEALWNLADQAGVPAGANSIAARYNGPGNGFDSAYDITAVQIS